MSKRNVPEPDIVTATFSIKRLPDVPQRLADALADLEVRRREGTIPLVVAGDLVVLYARDFLVGADDDR